MKNQEVLYAAWRLISLRVMELGSILIQESDMTKDDIKNLYEKWDKDANAVFKLLNTLTRQTKVHMENTRINKR